VIRFSQAFLIQTITEKIFPCWYNTPCDFKGTTQQPGKGRIACGYFVTTVLRDAGFLIPRVKWAQFAPESMIHALALSAKWGRIYNSFIQITTSPKLV